MKEEIKNPDGERPWLQREGKARRQEMENEYRPKKKKKKEVLFEGDK